MLMTSVSCLQNSPQAITKVNHLNVLIENIVIHLSIPVCAVLIMMRAHNYR